jgi:hypothetical protein
MQTGLDGEAAQPHQVKTRSEKLEFEERKDGGEERGIELSRSVHVRIMLSLLIEVTFGG